MKIFFGQIYIKPGISFPFSLNFQKRLSDEVSILVKPSRKFTEQFGSDWNLIFRISAKPVIKITEIRGPTVFRKDKNVEFTLCLPFDVIQRDADTIRSAFSKLFDSACAVFKDLDICTASLEERKGSLIESICLDPSMITESVDT